MQWRLKKEASLMCEICKKGILLTDGELLPLFDGHIARFTAHKEGETIALEIPIPHGRYERYKLLENIRSLLHISGDDRAT